MAVTTSISFVSHQVLSSFVYSDYSYMKRYRGSTDNGQSEVNAMMVHSQDNKGLKNDEEQVNRLLRSDKKREE